MREKPAPVVESPAPQARISSARAEPNSQGSGAGFSGPDSTSRSVVQPPNPLNPAVIALLNQANASARTGDLERSGQQLERALRITPSDAWLWYRLALVRLFQKRFSEAESLATKSLSLAGNNRPLKADAWRLIAQVREAQGHAEAAEEAAKTAAALDR